MKNRLFCVPYIPPKTLQAEWYYSLNGKISGNHLTGIFFSGTLFFFKSSLRGKNWEEEGNGFLSSGFGEYDSISRVTMRYIFNFGPSGGEKVINNTLLIGDWRKKKGILKRVQMNVVLIALFSKAHSLFEERASVDWMMRDYHQNV